MIHLYYTFTIVYTSLKIEKDWRNIVWHWFKEQYFKVQNMQLKLASGKWMAVMECYSWLLRIKLYAIFDSHVILNSKFCTKSPVYKIVLILECEVKFQFKINI